MYFGTVNSAFILCIGKVRSNLVHSKPRILLYSHDTFGLGHLRRSLSIAKQIACYIPGSHQLLITGSMVAGAFGLPPRLDMVKLPALSKRSSGKYKSRALPITLKQTIAWREQMILQAVINFRPDLVLVDKVAGGVRGELLPALRHLKTWSPDTRLVLGMRDIEDDPETTRAEWAANGTAQLHRYVYDRILLYGQRDLFDPVEAYGMSEHVTAKLTATGYLRRAHAPRTLASVRGELNIGDEPLILVTIGGGGDGYDIIKTYLDMLASFPDQTPYHSLIVTGPLMAQKKRTLLRRTVRNGSATLIEFTPDLISYMAAADLVVSMAGYNTTCEIMSLQKRALLIPRVHVRTEQLIRAERLAERGLVHVLHPAELSPKRLATTIETAMAAPPPSVTLDMNGLERITKAIHDLLEEARAGGTKEHRRRKEPRPGQYQQIHTQPHTMPSFMHYG